MIKWNFHDEFICMQLGGQTNRHGISSRNWYMWNHISERHEDYSLYLTHPHFLGDFTRIPEDAEILKTCRTDGN